jgi:hypothetical protein
MCSWSRWTLLSMHLFELTPLVYFLVQHVLLYFFVILGSTLLGMFETQHIFQVDISCLSYNPIGLFCMFSCQHILLHFEGLFGAINDKFLSLHSQNVDRVKVWQCNVYLSETPFQWPITHLKRSSYAKVTTPRSWGTNLPKGAHMTFGVSPPRIRFFYV